MTHRRDRAPRGNAEGFTLVEVVVAMAILGFTLLGLIGAGMTAVRASALARTNSQAADILNAELERIRSLAYASVVHVASDTTLATAPGVAPDLKYGGEPLDIQTTGAVTPVKTTRSVRGTTYTIYRYVTVPSVAVTTINGEPSLRRITVRTEWKRLNRDHSRTSSTLVTDTRRGLPLPNYRFEYHGIASRTAGRFVLNRNPGASADVGLRLTNLGARDAWDITATQSGWSFYVDTNRNGVWDGIGTEPALTDTSGNGVADSGALEPNSTSMYVVAQRNVGASETGSQTVDFLAQSTAQPTVAPKSVLTLLVVTGTSGSTPSASPTPTPTPTATSAAVPCTPGAVNRVGSASSYVPSPPNHFSTTTLKLFNGNGSIDGDSTTQAVGILGSSGQNAPGDCNYSTDLQSGFAGRLLNTGANARWEYGPTATSDQFGGTASVTIWAQCPSSVATLTISIASRTGGVDTVRGTTPLTLTGCTSTDFRPFSAYFSVGNTNGQNAAFSLTTGSADRLVLTMASNQPVRLLYEAPLSDARLTIGAK